MKGMSFFFVAFVTIVVGGALLVVVADSITPITTPYTISNETLTISREPADAMSINETVNKTTTFDDWVTDSVTVKNLSGTALVLDTDYTVDYDADVINFLNSSAMYAYASNNTGVYYQFYDSNYVNDTGTRAVTGLIVLMFAIGLVLAIVAGFKQSSEGIFG